jgi:similar to spore coat protein
MEMTGRLMKEFSGMGDMTDQVIAQDFMSGIKSAIRSYAWALSETATPQLRDILKRHLDAAVNAQAAMSGYLVKKGFYMAYDPLQQFAMDIQAAEKVLGMHS